MINHKTDIILGGRGAVWGVVSKLSSVICHKRRYPEITWHYTVITWLCVLVTCLYQDVKNYCKF